MSLFACNYPTKTIKFKNFSKKLIFFRLHCRKSLFFAYIYVERKKEHKNMKIELHEITVREVAENYSDNAENCQMLCADCNRRKSNV